MGRELIRTILFSRGFHVAGANVRSGSELAGRDIGEIADVPKIGVIASVDPQALVADVDVIVDFSSAEAACGHVLLASEKKIPIVVGVTGFCSQQFDLLREAATTNAVLVAPNTSVGVAILTRLTRIASAALGPEWDRSILDIHHWTKKDVPSGTAKALCDALESGFRESASCEGADPIGRKAAPVEIASIRAGTIVGDHTVCLAGVGERIELTHKAQDRAVYAHGALRAAGWLYGRSAGFYAMEDVVA